MGKTAKVQLAHKVHKRLKDPELPHPIHGGTPQELQDWMRAPDRHGNKRKAMAGLKTKARKARRGKEKQAVKKEIGDAMAPGEEEKAKI